MQKKKTLSCLQDNVFLIVFQWPRDHGVPVTLFPQNRNRWPCYCIRGCPSLSYRLSEANGDIPTGYT